MSLAWQSEPLHSALGSWHDLGCAYRSRALYKCFWAAKRIEQEKHFWRQWTLYTNTWAWSAKLTMFERAEPAGFHELSLYSVNILYMHILRWLRKKIGVGKRWALKLVIFIWSCSPRIKNCALRRCIEKPPSTCHALAVFSLPVVLWSWYSKKKKKQPTWRGSLSLHIFLQHRQGVRNESVLTGLQI